MDLENCNSTVPSQSLSRLRTESDISKKNSSESSELTSKVPGSKFNALRNWNLILEDLLLLANKKTSVSKSTTTTTVTTTVTATVSESDIQSASSSESATTSTSTSKSSLVTVNTNSSTLLGPGHVNVSESDSAVPEPLNSVTTVGIRPRWRREPPYNQKYLVFQKVVTGAVTVTSDESNSNTKLNTATATVIPDSEILTPEEISQYFCNSRMQEICDGFRRRLRKQLVNSLKD